MPRKKVVKKRVFKSNRKPKGDQFTKKDIAKFKKTYNPSIESTSVYVTRSPRGVDKIFSTPEDMKDAMIEYFNFVDSTPFKNESWKNAGRNLVLTKVNVRRPYSIAGMMLYFGVSSKYLNVFCLERQRDIEHPKSSKALIQQCEDFLNVIEWGRECVREQKFDGAAVGHFNANLISYDLGLVKKVDVTSDGEAIKQPEFKIYNNAPPLADSEEKVSKKRN